MGVSRTQASADDDDDDDGDRSIAKVAAEGGRAGGGVGDIRLGFFHNDPSENRPVFRSCVTITCEIHLVAEIDLRCAKSICKIWK